MILYRFFFFNDTATTEIYTLSLHDALPIFSELAAAPTSLLLSADRLLDARPDVGPDRVMRAELLDGLGLFGVRLDRKSTRLNSSHANISYAVFCLKKKKNKSYKT